ncbi:MAG: YdeI/OmpD-associated family protein [Sphingomonas sp.]
MSADPRVDAYIEASADFARPILTWLRARVHAACPDVEEAIKWSRPSYQYKGNILAGTAAFKKHVTLGFWDRENVSTGKEREAAGQFGRITSLDDLPSAAEIEALVREAAARIDAGQMPKRPRREPKPEAEVPPELAEALAEDAIAKATFDGFPPGCRREYCEWIADAKRPETRAKRVEEAMGWMREGKRRNWKYENC